MRISYIDRSRWWGGAEESLAWLAAGMARRGCDVEILVDYPEPHHARFAQEGLTVTPRMARRPLWAAERWRRPPRGLDRLGVIARARWLARRLKAQGADIVHINLLRDRSRWDVEAAQGAGAAVVGHLRQLQHQTMPLAVLSRCDRVIAVSEIVAAQARARGFKGPLEVIYDGVDAAKFVFQGAKAAARAQIGAPASGLVIGFPAALESRKGQDIALDAFARLADAHPDATLVFAGPVPELPDATEYLARLRRRASAPDLTGRVVFMGPSADMAAFYAASDVILALSRDGEAFGRVPVEAALAERPVIAANAGATPEVIADGETGLLTAPGDALAVEAALRRLLADPELAREIGRKAHARAMRLFEPNAALDAFEALYATTLRQRRP